MSDVLIIEDTRLEYRWIGRPPDEATTLVFLHHGLGCVGTWRDFPDRLVELTGLGGLVYSRAGYGRSDTVDVPRPLTYMEDEARDVLSQVLDQSGIRKAILVGHSDGASIAAIYTGGSGDLRVRGLVLMAPHFFNEPICVETAAEVRQDFEEGDLRARLERHHGHNVDCAFWGWNRVWLDPGFRDWNIEDYLDYIRVPILAIQGADDRYGTLRQLQALEEGTMCPVETIVLPDCGHSPFVDRPETTLALVADFVDRLVTVHGETVSTNP
jgi:pimeloyl-ACP methyl ester carboxylesterase